MVSTRAQPMVMGGKHWDKIGALVNRRPFLTFGPFDFTHTRSNGVVTEHNVFDFPLPEALSVRPLSYFSLAKIVCADFTADTAGDIIKFWLYNVSASEDISSAAQSIVMEIHPFRIYPLTAYKKYVLDEGVYVPNPIYGRAMHWRLKAESRIASVTDSVTVTGATLIVEFEPVIFG